MTSIHLVIPIKDPGQAKQRLSSLLDQPARQSLFLAMMQDTLDAAEATTGLDSVSVVTRDDFVARQARRRGMRIIHEVANDGHTEAVAKGIASLAALYGDDIAVMTLPADLPCVTPDDIGAVVCAHVASMCAGVTRAATLVPAFDYQGTNAAVLSPANLVPLRFGDNSFHPHVDALKQLGVSATVVENQNIGIDVDIPCDFHKLTSFETGVMTAAWLARYRRPRAES